MRGRDVLLEVLATEDVRHVFGNPGTTELPFVDSLAGHPELAYVLALQEATAVAMADGYAQATGRPAFLNLHTAAGLGNAIGNLTNARANRAPLVVTAGQQHRQQLVADPLLSGDLVGLAAPVSRWTHEVRHAAELGTVLRRAFRDAAVPPAGPVFVSIPMDVLDEDAPGPAPPRSPAAASGPAGRLDALAELLAAHPPERVALVAGEEVAGGGAVDALVALAQVLGCRVHGSPLHSVTVFPTAHGLWAGPLPARADGIRAALDGYDLVLLVGSHAFLVYPYAPGPVLPDHTPLAHLAPDATAVARTHPVVWAGAGDVRASVDALLAEVRGRVDVGRAQAALADATVARRADVERRETTARDRYPDQPMHPMAAVHALLRALPEGTPVVDEAITTGSYVRGLHHTRGAGTYFFCRGGGLGWGMPAACGVSLARDRAPVLCLVGDGSAMYSPQALWTAVHEGLPVVFAVVNNRRYAILHQALQAMGGDSVAHDRFVAMDIDDPPVDFVALAASMGVAATRVEAAADVGDATAAALAAGAPHLLELPIATRG